MGATSDRELKNIAYKTAKGPVYDCIKRMLEGEENDIETAHLAGIYLRPAAWQAFKELLAPKIDCGMVATSICPEFQFYKSVSTIYNSLNYGENMFIPNPLDY